MTENDGDAPRDPQPETPLTQPLPSSSPAEESGAHAFAPQHGAQPVAPQYGAQPVAPQYGPGPVAPQYGYAPSPPKNDLAVWSLITGILSYVMCPLLLGIAAIVTGTMARKAADEGLANNRGMATAGLILGWVNVGLSLLGIVLFIVALAAGLFAGGIGTISQLNDVTY